MKLNILPARIGLHWVKLGVQTFFKQPLAISGLFIMFMMLMSVVSLVPYIGTGLMLTLLPAATLGLMAASREVSLGRFPMPTLLFIALRAPRTTQRALGVLGVIYAVLFLGIMALSALIDGGKFTQIYLMGAQLTPELLADPSFQWASLVALVLFLPLSMMFWHAPALVHWHGVPPIKSLFFSFVASSRNLGAWLTYSAAWVGLFALAGLVVTLLAGLVGGPQLAATLLPPLALILMAMLLCSVYFTVRDSFASPESENL
jgi:hypothetical protein